MSYDEYFSRSPAVMAGKTVIKGTRVPIKQLMICIAEGQSREWILDEYPGVSADALDAVIRFAAEAAQDDVPFLDTKKSA